MLRATPLRRPSARIRAILGGMILWQGCAAAGPPRGFTFESNRPPADALGCALDVLSRNGFRLPDPVPDTGAVLALRAPSSAAPLDERQWWMIELGVTPGGRVPSVLAGSSGVARRMDGPFEEPGPPLDHVLGEISARCTWGTALPGAVR